MFENLTVFSTEDPTISLSRGKILHGQLEFLNLLITEPRNDIIVASISQSRFVTRKPPWPIKISHPPYRHIVPHRINSHSLYFSSNLAIIRASWDQSVETWPRFLPDIGNFNSPNLAGFGRKSQASGTIDLRYTKISQDSPYALPIGVWVPRINNLNTPPPPTSSNEKLLASELEIYYWPGASRKLRLSIIDALSQCEFAVASTIEIYFLYASIRVNRPRCMRSQYRRWNTVASYWG